MGNLGGKFDATQIPPDVGRVPVPSGEYICMIVDSSMRATKDGGGQYAELVHEIAEGPYRGRKVWARLNLVNRNQQTQSIAQGKLSAICHATGVLQPEDTQQLHHRPMLCHIEYIKADGQRQRSDSNEVNSWKSAPVAGVGAGTVGMPPQSAPAPAAGPAPWMRGKAA